MGLRLRPVDDDDAERISELLAQLGWAVTPAQVVDELAAEPATDVTVAELGGKVVGLIAVATRRQFHRAGTVTTIDALVVDEQYRSKLIGAQLVGVALDAARRSGSQIVEVVSNLRRVEARRFYERLGFDVAANYFLLEV